MARPKPTGPSTFGRRTFVVLGAFGLAGGALALVRTAGYDVDAATAAKLRALSPWQYLTVRAIADRIVAPDDAGERSILSATDAKVADFVDGYLDAIAAPLRRDMLSFVAYVEQVAPFGSGYLRRFTRLASPEQDDVLRGLERSRIGDLRAGFDAIKSLVMMGYYRDPRSWKTIGYDGPFVPPKERGN